MCIHHLHFIKSLQEGPSLMDMVLAPQLGGRCRQPKQTYHLVLRYCPQIQQHENPLSYMLWSCNPLTESCSHSQIPQMSWLGSKAPQVPHKEAPKQQATMLDQEDKIVMTNYQLLLQTCTSILLLPLDMIPQDLLIDVAQRCEKTQRMV